MKTQIGIIGAGITGLTTAYLLKKQGISVAIYEAAVEPGGAMKTHREDGWLAESGPNTIMARSQKLLDLMDELGLSSELVFANDQASKRFIVRNGKPMSMPTSLYDFITTDLFSMQAKLRLLKEPFVDKWEDRYEENLAHFVERRLGIEFLDYAINPFVAGVYAGDPEHLSVKHAFEKLYQLEQDYGSLIWGQIRGTNERKKREDVPKTESKLFSFKKGNQQLPYALSRKLNSELLLNHQIDGLSQQSDGWGIKGKSLKGRFEHKHKAIIYTAPIHAIKNIIFTADTQINHELFEEVTYPPISVISLGFNAVHIAHELDGFGMLIPRKEEFNILGTLFNSTLFPNRAPEGQVLLTTFVGGMRNPDLAGLPMDELRELVITDLDELLGVIGGPVFEYHKYWPKSIPQYDVGYGKVLEKFRQIEKQCSGFIFAGNYRYGISVSDCLNSGFTVAERISELV